MLGLIDGDGFVYWAGFSVEKTRYLVECKEGGFWHPANMDAAKAEHAEGDILWTRKELGTIEKAKENVDNAIAEALRHVGVHKSDATIFLSPVAGNFRERIGTVRKYKGNRDDHPRPVYYAELRDHLVRNWDARIAQGVEADDQLSVLSRHHQSSGTPCTVIGQDKDLYQIPGHHYNWVTGDKIHMSERDSRAWFWTQVLSGDPGDNILGCYRVGPAKARKLVQTQSDLSDAHMWPLVVSTYEKSKLLPGCPYKDKPAWDVALEMARLVRLNVLAYERTWEPDITKKDKDVAKVQREDSSAPLFV